MHDTFYLEFSGDDKTFIAEQLLGEALEAEFGAKPKRYVVNDNWTVFDTSTGLTWQREVVPGFFDWKAAKDYAARLLRAGGGWRLPTVEELKTLVDADRKDPCIDVTAFPDTPPEWFWSASPYAYSSYSAWGVNFGNGNTLSYSVNYNSRVRCVR